MTDVIVVPQAAQWQRLKRMVLDSVSSPITRRVYNLGLDEFFEWYGQEVRPGFTKATVATWRVALRPGGSAQFRSTYGSRPSASSLSKRPTTGCWRRRSLRESRE